MQLHGFRRSSCGLALLAVGLFVALPSSAVIIDSGDGTGNTSAPFDDPGWRYVGLRAGLTAVYLGNGWVISANHVAPGDVVLDGVSYPWVAGSQVQLMDAFGEPADLAVFELDPAPEWPLLPISAEADISGEFVVMIGQGRERGAAESACTPTREGYLWGGAKTMRWGENQIVDHRSVLGTHAISTRFDGVGLAHEAQAADGDSGGGVFVKRGGRWELAGVMMVMSEYGCQPHESAFHGNMTYSADLAAYRDQILALTRPQCSDGIDNDGDLLVDHPQDPDCTSEFGALESSPAVPSGSRRGRAFLLAWMLGMGTLVGRRRSAG